VTPRPPGCPRCGYDLSGAVAAWSDDACPTKGICSECGLDILWRDVLNPAYASSDLFFETAKRRLPRAFRITLWGAVRPWKLWSWLQMQFPFRPSRAALFTCFAFALLWLCGAAMLATVSWGIRHFFPTWWWRPTWIDLFFNSFTPFGRGAWITLHTPTWFIGTLLWWTLAPISFALVPLTLRQAHVRPSHLMRVWAYSWIGLPFALYITAAARACAGHAIEKWAGTLPGRLPTLCRWTSESPAIPVALAALWLIVSWRSAAKHYLRLPRPGLVAAALLLVAMLLIVAIASVGAYLFPSQFSWMIEDFV
jgi:hypothetical protein